MAVLLAFLAYALARPQFGGEDPLAPAGTTWHHENITRDAAAAAGWQGQAVDSLAFHADYLDSYLYNPLWWVQGGLDRAKVGIASAPQLTKLHFDDLFAPEKVVAMWRRYLGGTIAGLLWAADQPASRRVSLAHNLLGTGLHAMQDFYSHSNWIDAASRRKQTWFEMSGSTRQATPLWTAYYELGAQLGIKPHGKLLPLCKLFDSAAVTSIMRLVCHAASPLSKSGACDMFDRCRTSTPAQPRTIAGVALPPNVGSYEPGIAVDSTWQASIGAQERGLSIDGTAAFDAARELAVRTSTQWLQLVEAAMRAAGHQAFWNQIMTTGKRYTTDTDPFERFDQLPYAFLSAGDYPPKNSETGREWYVRATIRTSNIASAGTDADIEISFDGRAFGALDYSPRKNPILGWNDFERGDVASYVVGPLPAPPTLMHLKNAAPTGLGVVQALVNDLTSAFTSAINSLGSLLLSLIGGHADFVQQNKRIFTSAELEALGSGASKSFTVRLNGGSEGDYRVEGTIAATGTTGTDSRGVAWREYRITLQRLHCIKESAWDRGTTSDEPFLCYLVIPHGGTQSMQKGIAGPYSGVDSGDTRNINRTHTVRVPRSFGFISAAFALFESDSESAAARQKLLDDYAAGVKERTDSKEKGFFVTLGEFVASGWRPESIDVVAFRRWPEAEVCTYQTVRPGRWINGGESFHAALQTVACRSQAVPWELATPGVKTPVDQKLPIPPGKKPPAPPGRKPPGKKPPAPPGKKPPGKKPPAPPGKKSVDQKVHATSAAEP